MAFIRALILMSCMKDLALLPTSCTMSRITQNDATNHFHPAASHVVFPLVSSLVQFSLE